MSAEIKVKNKILSIIMVALLVTFAIDIVRISQYETYPDRPAQRIENNESQVYWDLLNGDINIDRERLDGTLEYIKGEYDCADFRLVNLIRKCITKKILLP